MQGLLGYGLRPNPTYKRLRMPSEQDTSLDVYIDAVAAALGLAIEPEWKPGIKANLQVTLRLAALVADFELPDEAEPAPVFGA
jgi:hypothetical protein